MFRLPLFRIRAFTFGTLSTFLSAVARGGLMFMLIIWLQGIWLPQHGYDFTETPLWAGIYMLPLTLGHARRRAALRLPLRPLRRALVRHRRDARRGAQLRAADCCCRSTSPSACSRSCSRSTGISMGMFASPNRAAVMNSLPPGDRGAGGGMNQTFQNSAQVLSIGIFFTLMILGLSRAAAARAGDRPAGARRGRRDAAQQSPRCRRSRSCSRRSSATTRSSTSSARTCWPRSRRTARRLLTGRSFFPHLISAPFRSGLHEAFVFAIVACLIAAAASLMRGGRYHYDAAPRDAGVEPRAPAARGVPAMRSANSRPRGAACRLSGMASRRFASAPPSRRCSSTRSGTCRPLRSAACSSTTPRSRASSADLLLVTHEHLRPQRRRGDRRRPRGPALDRGHARVAVGEVVAVASEHDEAAGTERGPNTIFVFALDGIRVCHFGDFGQRALRDEQAAALGEVDLLILPVGGGPTIGAEQAHAIVDGWSRVGRADALPHRAHQLPGDRRRVPGAVGRRAAAPRPGVPDRRAVHRTAVLSRLFRAPREGERVNRYRKDRR